VKKGTKEGTHPRLTLREHNDEELSPFASCLTAIQASEQSQPAAAAAAQQHHVS
jgi:hypothetical protein